MALIKHEEDLTHVMRDYEISHTKSRENTLIWIALISKNPEIHVEQMILDDFESYHDGSISTTLEKIDAVDAFIHAHKSSAIKAVSMVGTYRERPFNLSVNLNSGSIGLCCRKSKPVDYESLERILGLV